MSTTGDTSTESNAAMSLWQKFAELQNTADALRTERRQIEGASERLREDLHRMQREIELESQWIQSNANITEETQQQLGDDLDNANADYAAAVKAKNDATMSLEQWTAWKQEEMESNMEYERLFRIQCEQWQLRAMAVHLDDAVVEAAAYARDPTNLPRNPHALQSHLSHTQLQSNDPLLWDLSEEYDDDELKVAIAKYREQLNERKSVEQTVEQAREALQSIVDKQMASDHRSADCQKRLDAILGECKGLQASLAEVEELILHEEALVGTYRNKLEERNRPRTNRNPHHASFESLAQLTAIAPQRQQSPDRAGGIGVQNPYMQHRNCRPLTTATTTPPPPRPELPPPNPVTEPNVSFDPTKDTIYRADVVDAVLGPHRRRRDRYFGCSLSIGGPTAVSGHQALLEDDSDDDLLYSPTFTKKRKNATHRDDSSAH